MAIQKRTATDTTALDPARVHRAAVATVPDQIYYDTYVSRSFHGKSEMELFDFALEGAINVLIEGPTGPGKTSAVLAYAAHRKIPFYSIQSNIGIEPSQLFGKYIPQSDGTFAWQDGPVTAICRDGGCLLVNEINFMPARVSTSIFGLLDKRREFALLDHKGEVIRLHKPNCWCDLAPDECRRRWVLILGDMNPEYYGTAPLNAALRNRFAIQLFWNYDAEVEANLVKSHTLLNEIAKKIRGQIEAGVIQTPVSTNMLQEFERFALSTLGLEFAIENFVNHFDANDRSAVQLVFNTFTENLEREYADMGDEGEDNPDEWSVFANDANWIYQQEGTVAA